MSLLLEFFNPPATYGLRKKSKMNIKQSLISCALFAIVILCSQAFFINPVYAVEGVHVVSSMTSTDLFYNGGANTYIAHTSSTTTIEKISPTTFLRTTATLPTATYNSRGDCSLTTDVCVWTTNANLIKAVKSDGTSLWSVTADSSATTGAGFTDIVESLGIVLVSVVCNGNNNRILQEYDIGTGVFIKNVGNCAGTALGNNINTLQGHLTSSTEYALTMSGSGQVGNFQIWNISPATPTRTCTWATVTTLVGNEGDIIKIGTTYYVSDGTTMQALSTTCTDGTDITSTSHGMSTIVGLVASTVRNEYYVQDTTGFAVMNLTAPTQKLGEITCDGTGASTLTELSVLADEFIQIACLSDTNNTVTVVEITAVGTGEGGTAFCDQPENANILICVTGGDGTLGSAGAFVIGNSTNGTGVLGIGCAIGLVDCTQDSNPQTNGLGLLIFIASLFVVLGMFYSSLGKGMFELPVFVYIIIVIALSAFFTITGIIDPVFLIISVVAIVALASPKVLKVIRGGAGDTFGGGSTE